MKTNTIITIGRQFASGGRDIGEIIAKDFGIKIYDKEMLSEPQKKVASVKKFLKHMMKSQQIVSYIHS